jgi:hypothetical protein
MSLGAIADPNGDAAAGNEVRLPGKTCKPRCSRLIRISPAPLIMLLARRYTDKQDVEMIF